MRKFVLGVAAFMLLVPALAAAKDSTFSGEIMDSQCAQMGSHDMMMKKEGINDKKMCTLNCVKMGGKFVLYNSSTKTVYQLDDQKKLEEFAGQNVKITGTLDKATNTIHVTAIKAAS
jgi:type 1 fimbria pilin